MKPAQALAAALALILSGGCKRATEPPPRVGVKGQSGTAAIAGEVDFSGPVPPALPSRSTAFPECNKGPGRTLPLLVQEGKLAEVFVWVKEGLAPGDYPVPAEPATLDQAGCEFSPRVLGLRAGQTLLVRNGDEALHNVHALGVGANAFNVAMPVKGMSVKETPGAPQVMLTIACDVHPWMRAYVGVVAHPFFAVTGADGRFALRGLPAGKYVVEAWHERLGRSTQAVQVGEGQTRSLTFALR